MLKIRKASERGHADHGWLNSHHTFSFADYYDPAHMGFGQLRVINDDRVAPGRGFGTHPHRDMEIISYVLDGALAHKDSMGNGSEMRPGDVQRMSAGTGVTHSEFNPSADEPVHFLQIWILPDARGHEPGYEQKHFAAAEKRGRLRLVASREGRDGSVSLNQDVDLYAGLLSGEEALTFEATANRDVWVHIARGELMLNGQALAAGDGAALNGPGALSFTAGKDAEVLLFDMARRA
jgi:redox-sensitive bicupin YhaK (pirin superfamily)